MSTTTGTAPQGAVPAINIPDSQDTPRLVYAAPYFTTVPLAELIAPAVIEATEAALPALVPPYVNTAVTAAVQEQAVLLTGSSMSGPLYLNPIMPTQRHILPRIIMNRRLGRGIGSAMSRSSDITSRPDQVQHDEPQRDRVRDRVRGVLPGNRERDWRGVCYPVLRVGINLSSGASAHGAEYLCLLRIGR